MRILASSSLNPEVAADRAGGGFLGIGRSEKIADAGNDVVAFEGEGDHRGLLHEAAHAREEWLVRDVGVVLGEDLIAQRHHFHAADFESLGLIAGEDGADDILLHGVGLEENERCFGGHWGGGDKRRDGEKSKVEGRKVGKSEGRKVGRSKDGKWSRVDLRPSAF